MVGDAVGFALTARAMLADPESIELSHNGAYESGIVREETAFEISPILTFSSEACSGQVGTSRVGGLSVDDDRFEVGTWTEYHFHAIDEVWEAIVVGSKRWTWFFCVYQSYRYAFVD